MLFFKLIYLCNVDMKKKNTVAIHIASGLWTVGPHPVSLAAQPLARLRIQDLTPELTCEAPLLNYITFQNWRLEEQITSNLKPDSRTRPKPWLHANFTFSFFSFVSWPVNPVDVQDLTLSIFNIIGSQEKAIQYFHLGYCLVFFSDTCRFYLDLIRLTKIESKNI